MATIIEVAKAAGVSQGAASDILRGTFRYKYRSATIDSVREAAARLGYQANPAARMLRQQTKTIVGLAVPLEEFGKQSLARMVAAAHRVLAAQGFHPMQVESRQLIAANSQVPFPNLDLMAGVLSADAQMEESVPEYYQMLQSKLPVVALYPSCSPKVSYVTVDRTRIIEMAVEHLTALGHRRIAVAGNWESLAFTDRLKVEGWPQVVSRFNLDPNPDYVIRISNASAGKHHESAREIAGKVAALDPRPTALVCLGGLIAIGTMSCLAAMNWKVPEEMSVMGYDYEADRVGAVSFPPLTGLVRPIEQIAELASNHLVHLIRDAPEENLLAPLRQMVDPVLIVRSSTGPPPMRP